MGEFLHFGMSDLDVLEKPLTEKIDLDKGMLEGCYTAIVTPFKEEEKRWKHPINYNGVNKLLEHQINGKVDGVVVAGCTGAASVLSHDEQVKLVKYVQDHFGDKILVIAGDGSNSTREARELAKRMEQEAGVFWHLSISPYYNKPSDRGIRRHYEIIADNIEGKLILYSVPGRTGGKGILPDVVEELASHPRIVGIKEASGNIDRIKETIERTRDKDFFVISGDDNMTYKIIESGGVGVISVAANVMPGMITEMVHYALKGDCSSAFKLDRKLSGLYAALFPKSESENPSANPVMCHYALNRIGIPVGIPRLPLTDGERLEKMCMDKVLKDLELI